MKLRCTQCGCEFERRKFRKFCSGDCFHVWSRGRINRGQKTLNHRIKLSNALAGRPHLSAAFLSPERGRKISATRKGMKFSEQHCRALSEAKVRSLELGKFHGRQSEYVSIKTGERNWAHSRWERQLMRMFDERSDIIYWTKNHNIRIPYQWNGRQRTYVPDFYIVDDVGIVTLLEAKGYEYEPERCALKYAAAKELCTNNGWRWNVAYQALAPRKD